MTSLCFSLVAILFATLESLKVFTSSFGYKRHVTTVPKIQNCYLLRLVCEILLCPNALLCHPLLD